MKTSSSLDLQNSTNISTSIARRSICGMADAPDAEEVLRSTAGKTNFQRLARLLISGGTSLLREVFDSIHPPTQIPTLLSNPTAKTQLKAANLTKPQWDCLYPSPGVYGKSKEFDVTLLFRLLRTLCNLIPPAKGWDALPATADLSLTADLSRIKYFRNSVYGHVNQSMEITDDEFSSLWQEISGALVRIAGQISHAKKIEWQEAIDNFLKNPLTVEDERYVEEIARWYQNDIEVKKSIEDLKISTREGIAHLETTLERRLSEIARSFEATFREEAQGMKDQLGKMQHSIGQSLGGKFKCYLLDQATRYSALQL